MNITVRHSEPEDYKELHRIFSGPKAVAGTLQMPFPRAEMWRERLSEPPEGLYSLVACVEGEVVGSLGLETSPTRRLAFRAGEYVDAFSMARLRDR
jgi:L-phenylalanine/L-methionine N-acetyltransferase